MEQNRLLKSKILAWIALFLCFVVLILSMAIPGIKKEWWELTDIFFFFMMSFSHIAALYLEKMSVQASRTLDKFAFVFGLLGIISLIVVYFINL